MQIGQRRSARGGEIEAKPLMRRTGFATERPTPFAHSGSMTGHPDVTHFGAKLELCNGFIYWLWCWHYLANMPMLDGKESWGRDPRTMV